MNQVISVRCGPEGAGWRCSVTVGEDADATVHEVAVSRALLERLRQGAEAPEELVRDSFAFLLAREPRESILRAFDLAVIASYFPEWEGEIRQRAPRG